MQQVGIVATYRDARRLGVYFRSHGSATRLEKRPDGWAIWVCNERHTSWTQMELEAFARNPNEARFSPRLSLESFCARLRPLERQIVELHHQGCSIAQIAGHLNVYERRVRRVLNRFEECWRRLHEGGA